MSVGSRTFEGTIAISQVEGRHFELVTDEGDDSGNYVLIAADEHVGRLLAASVGKRVRLVGSPHGGVSIYMCGTPLKVTAVHNLGGRAR